MLFQDEPCLCPVFARAMLLPFEPAALFATHPDFILVDVLVNFLKRHPRQVLAVVDAAVVRHEGLQAHLLALGNVRVVPISVEHTSD